MMKRSIGIAALVLAGIQAGCAEPQKKNEIPEIPFSIDAPIVENQPDTPIRNPRPYDGPLLLEGNISSVQEVENIIDGSRRLKLTLAKPITERYLRRAGSKETQVQEPVCIFYELNLNGWSDEETRLGLQRYELMRDYLFAAYETSQERKIPVAISTTIDHALSDRIGDCYDASSVEIDMDNEHLWRPVRQ